MPILARAARTLRDTGRGLKRRSVALLRLQLRVLGRLRVREMHASLAWAGLVGLLGALTTVLFRECIHWLEVSLLHHSASLVLTARQLPWWERLLSPIIGGVLAGAILQYGMRLTRKQSSTDYMEAIAIGNGVISARASLVKSSSSLMTVASGGSIGREGSMVQLSAMAASLVGRVAAFPEPRLRLLVACGASAGIASAYNAPIAGALFVSEIVLGSIALESFGPLVFASVIANTTIHRFFGYQPIFPVPAFKFASNWDLLLYTLLGLAAGLLAPWFLRLLDASRRWFTAIPVALSVRLGLGGVVVGLLSVLTPEVWGNGYSVVGSILRTHWPWFTLLLVLADKVIATAATAGSGAVGGVFTPTLFMGTAIGALFGQGVHTLLPAMTSVPSAYALVGMGAFLAGVTHAPLTAILMVFEMTLDYQIVLPLMLACVVAHQIASVRREESVYTESLREKRRRQPRARDVRTVDPLMTKDPPVVGAEATLDELYAAFATHQVNCLYAVDGDERRLLGIIPLSDVVRTLRAPEQAKALRAADLAQARWPVLTPGMSVAQALERFMQFPGERLPVVDDPATRRLVGAVSKTDLLLVLQTKLAEAAG